MASRYEQVINQIDQVLADCNLRSPKGYSDYSDLSQEVLSVAVNRLTSAVSRLARTGSNYRIAAATEQRHLVGNVGLAIAPLRGILIALRDDYAAGYLQSVEELIHADLFADFLDMSTYFLSQGYKDPAAVITGSVLEEHLRKLCSREGLALIQSSGAPKKADTLNADLTGASVYSKLDQKSVTAWLDLRNKAAHGQYGEYTKDQVALMQQGILDFMSRHPA